MTAQTKTKPAPKVLSMTVSFQVSATKQGAHYNVYRATDGSWVCECMAWKNQPGVPAAERACKHTQAAAVALGECVVAQLQK